MKFSVIILSYNQKDIIGNAIDSALNQTYKDIEVICVDDCSTDGSADILKKYEQYPNFKLVVNPKNSGITAGRKAGIKAATGDRIVFVDGDDSLNPNTCEVLYNTIESKNPDIISYGVKLCFTSDFSDAVKDSSDEYFNYESMYLSAEKAMELCYIDRKINWCMNKCYNVDIAKKVAENLPDEYIIMAEDFLFNFVAFSLSKTYAHINEKLYNYSFGCGCSTSRRLSAGQLKAHFSASFSLRACEEYAAGHNLTAKYKEAISVQRKNNIRACYDKLATLNEKEKRIAARQFIDAFGLETIIEAICDTDQKTAAQIFNWKELYPVKRDKIKTVALYYHRMYNGGVERVMSLMSEFLSAEGYNVIVVTDQPANELDYPLAKGTKRVFLKGTTPLKCEDHAGRFKLWTDIIRENNIDAVIYNAWYNACQFYDMAAIKSMGAAYIIFCHGSFASDMLHGNRLLEAFHLINANADAIVTLSAADKLHWSHYNPNTFTVPNPPTFFTNEVAAAPLDNHRVLWLGRMEPYQKNAADALSIFRYVLDEVPDAVLTMVGQIPDWYEDYFNYELYRLKLNNHVELPGFTTEVLPYFQKSAVFLSTTNFEGYSMSYRESLSCGLPIVSYETPYHTVCRDSKAIVQTPWKDFEAAAREIIDILTDDEKRLNMGKAAREEASRADEYDFKAKWKEIVESTLEEHTFELNEIPMQDFNELIETYDLALRQVLSNHFEYEKYEAPKLYTNDFALEKKKEIYNSKTYKIGSSVYYLPQRILNKLRKKKSSFEPQSTDRTEDNFVMFTEEEIRLGLNDVYNSKRYKLGKTVLLIPRAIQAFINLFRK